MFVKNLAQFVLYRKFLRLKRQFSIGSYRINLYFPEHKLATECDEHNHKDRDMNYEIRKQKFIEDQLNCKCLRYYPNVKDFTIKSVLTNIFQYIYQKHSSWYLDTVLWPSSQTAKYHDEEEQIFHDLRGLWKTYDRFYGCKLGACL